MHNSKTSHDSKDKIIYDSKDESHNKKNESR